MEARELVIRMRRSSNFSVSRAPPNVALQLTLDPGAAPAIASAAPASSAAELCC